MSASSLQLFTFTALSPASMSRRASSCYSNNVKLLVNHFRLEKGLNFLSPFSLVGVSDERDVDPERFEMLH